MHKYNDDLNYKQKKTSQFLRYFFLEQIKANISRVSK